MDEAFRVKSVILQNVRAVLNKYAVDLAKLRFSCPNGIVELYGHLQKVPRGLFSPSAVIALSRELLVLPYVRDVVFRLEDWDVSPGLTAAHK